LGAHGQLAVAEDIVARLPHVLPAALDVEGILADQPGLDLVEDDADHIGLRLEFVAVVDFAKIPAEVNTG
jgi:hypothetical protein